MQKVGRPAQVAYCARTPPAYQDSRYFLPYNLVEQFDFLGFPYPRYGSNKSAKSSGTFPTGYEGIVSPPIRITSKCECCLRDNSWDNLYTTEITNHSLDPSDEGTIWFDDSAAEDKVIAFLGEQVLGSKLLSYGVGKENCSFLDLGTGNGHFLFRLRQGDEDEGESGWGGRMLGVDYSQKSVEFARRIAGDKCLEGEAEVEFKWWDIMAQDPAGVVLEGKNESGWDVVLDKGTFDAISLSEEKDARGRRICEGYKEKVVPLIRDGGIFLVTSCNWTEEELSAWFQGSELQYLDAIKYKSFSFGGKKGQTISSVCFKKHARR